MAKPKGAMSSPYTGFAQQMKESGAFGTVGTEQNLEKVGETKATPVEAKPAPAAPVTEVKVQNADPIVEAPVTEQFSDTEISSLVVNLSKVAKITAASPDSVEIEIQGVAVKVTKK
jgi:hypothetical protein